MRLSREFFRATEAALYAYPSILQQIRNRERYIEALSYASAGCNDPVQGGVKVATQERVFERKEGDMLLNMLRLQASHIEGAVSTLPGEDLKKLAELRYFKRAPLCDILEVLAISERAFYRMRRKVVEHCAPYVLGPFGWL